jgi:hypothetical protein
MKKEVLFEEEQKFTQWWLWCLLIAPPVFIILKVAIQLYEMHSSVSKIDVTPISFSTDTIISLLIFLLVILLFLFLKLKTIITLEYIKIQYFPFFTKIINWTDIDTVNIVTYGFVGYGIRVSFKHGMVYNVKGNKGLAIRLKSDKRLLIGTQKEKKLEQLITQLKK